MTALFVPRQQSLAPVSSALSSAPSISQAPISSSTTDSASAPAVNASYDLSVGSVSSSDSHQRAATAPSGSPPSSSKTRRSRSHTTQAEGGGTPPSPGFFEAEDSQLTPKGSLVKKMFSCSGYGNCKMSFSRAEHLARHVRKHTGERPFQCHCGREFSRLDNLRQHAQTVHADQVDLNTEMMVRLAAVHNSLASSSAANRKTKTKPKALNTKKANIVMQEPVAEVEEGPTTPIVHPLQPPNPMYYQPQHLQPHCSPSAPLLPSPYICHDASPTQHDFAQRHAYPMLENQGMMPMYDGMMHPDAMQPEDYAYDLYSKPTLPSISALIPRKGGQVSPQQMAQYGLLPSPLQPTTSVPTYAGHTPVHAHSSTGYGYYEQQQSPPRSPIQATGSRTPSQQNQQQNQQQYQQQQYQQQQQQLNQYMSLHGSQAFAYPIVPAHQDFEQHFQILPRSFSASSASSGGSEPSLASGASSFGHPSMSYPSTPSPKHVRMAANQPHHMPYGGTQMPHITDAELHNFGQQPGMILYPLPPNQQDELPQDLTCPPSAYDNPEAFGRRQSLNDLLSAAQSGERTPQRPSYPQAVAAGGMASPNKRQRDGHPEIHTNDLFKRQHMMA